MTSKEYYDVKIVNDVIYNEPTHIVSVFKDFLIYDDVSEFLKRFYSSNESKTRLPKVQEFYDKYSKVFPNYVTIPENKYMFKNIERKQRIIDDKQRYAIDKTEKAKKNKLKGLNQSDANRLFTTKFIDSVLENYNPSIVKDSLFEDSVICSSSRIFEDYVRDSHHKPKAIKGSKKHDLESIIDQFLNKDSQFLPSESSILMKQ